MGSRLFLDTSGFYAWLVVNDPAHERAAELMNGAKSGEHHLVTSDYILDETATLLSVRGHRKVASRFLDAVEKSHALDVHWCNPEWFGRAAALFDQHPDKNWSFTDCFSLVLMDHLHISEAITTDHNFEQAGQVALLRT